MTHSIEELEPLAEKLRLTPILNTVKSLEEKPDSIHMSHIDYLYTLLTDEVLRREEVLLMKKVENAELLYEDACVPPINWTVNRQLDRKMINSLASKDYIRNSQNSIITGATGCGKTWLADAFGQNAPVWPASV